MTDHPRGRADEVGFGQDVGRALGMGEDPDAGVLATQQPDLLRPEALVHLAVTLPEDDLHVGAAGHVAAQVLVGQEDDPLAAERLDDLDRVGRGAADVRLRLHRRRGVDVGHHRHPRIALAQQAHVGGGDRGGQRAARLQVGDQDRLLRAQELGGLGHEVHAAEHDDLGVGLGRLARQGQRVAGQVGHAVEDLRGLVVVPEDHRPALPLEALDRLDVGGVERPLELRDHLPEALVDRCGGGGHLGAVNGGGGGGMGDR